MQTGNALSCEYLIVGGGLAGCALGFLLRKAGADVLILEWLDAQKKDKLCAGLTNDFGREQFESVFGGKVWERLSPRTVPYLRERYGEKELCSLMAFYGIPRKAMDDAALACYLEAGGRLIDRATVTAIDEAAGLARCKRFTDGEFFSVAFSRIIGADGALSVVRRLTTGTRQSTGFALEAPAPLLGDDAIFSYFPRIVGYGWYLPRGKDATVGSGRFDDTEQAVKNCREKLTDLCREIGIEPTGKIRGAYLPTGRDVLLSTGERTYFVGDAAGLIYNVWGGGIQYALLSARLLGEAFLGGDPYEEAMRPYVGTILDRARNARKIQFLMDFRIATKGKTIEKR